MGEKGLLPEDLRAHHRLCALHPDDWSRIYAEEQATEGIKPLSVGRRGRGGEVTDA